MKVAEAAHATVREYKDTEALAKAIGVTSAQMLRNKVNVSEDKKHHLTLREAELLMKETGNPRILHALASEIGGIYVPTPKNGNAGSLSIVSDISKMSKEFGALVEEVSKDIEDGIVTKNELKRIEADADKLRRALSSLIADLSAMYESNLKRTASASS
ncbi:phage regulatory CII family protein [Rhodocyclus tenuis]|uniref:phage regulatory CII family protein n=1 Tax=Rhodocyclus tenuis TaxID=1066 RepID=UPI00190516DE|nr:phage regulatory CII family protein [Rhodocyclus tenuis]MBK1681453.1 hypothetical protein [Rhodocyclus tenuis]